MFCLSLGRLQLTESFNGGVLDLANPTANVANTTNVPNTTVSGTNRALHSEGKTLILNHIDVMKTPAFTVYEVTLKIWR